MEVVEASSHQSAFVRVDFDGKILFLKCLDGVEWAKCGLLSCLIAHYLDIWLEHHFVVFFFGFFFFFFFSCFGLLPLVCLGWQLQLLSLGYMKQEEKKQSHHCLVSWVWSSPASLLPSFCLLELSYVGFTYNAHGLELYLGGERKVCYSIFQTLGM